MAVIKLNGWIGSGENFEIVLAELHKNENFKDLTWHFQLSKESDIEEVDYQNLNVFKTEYQILLPLIKDLENLGFQNDIDKLDGNLAFNHLLIYTLI